MTTVEGPLVLSMSLRRLLIQQFSVEELRHLASLKAAGSPGLQARQRLSEAIKEELAEMLTAGRTPTIGWWKRNAPVEVTV